MLCGCLLIAQTDESILEFMVEGRKAYNDGNLSAASIEFENILMIEPHNFEAMLWLTQIYLDSKQTDKAREMLARAAGIAPEHPRVLKLQSIIPVKPVHTKPIPQSFTPTRPLGIVVPPDRRVDSSKEDSYFRFDDIEIQRQDTVISDTPEGPMANVFETLQREGLQAALDKYFQMFVNDPSLAAVSDQGLLERGRNHFSGSEETQALYYIAMIRFVEGDYSTADEILRNIKDDVQADHAVLSKVLKSIDEWKETEKARLAALEYQRRQEAEREAAMLEAERQRREREQMRERLAQRGEELGTSTGEINEEAQANHDRGYDYYKRGNLDQAIEKFEIAIALDGTNPQYHYHHGLAHTDRGLAGDIHAFDTAIGSFENVISLEPNSQQANDARTMIEDIISARELMLEY